LEEQGGFVWAVLKWRKNGVIVRVVIVYRDIVLKIVTLLLGLFLQNSAHRTH
jgi:hypothetical protein